MIVSIGLCLSMQCESAFKCYKALTFQRHSPDISFPNCDTNNIQGNKTWPDSCSVLDKNEHAFSVTQWTFHFKRVKKRARSNVISFCRNVTTCTYFQWAWVANNSAILFVTILCAGGCNILHSPDNISVNNVHCQRDSEKDRGNSVENGLCYF